MSTQTTALPQLHLPGQAAAPAGPIDLTAMYVMHHAFRRDFSAFAAAARHTPVEAVETWRALLKRWQRLGMVLHHHHTGEDTGLWPLLRDRALAAGDAIGVETLDAMSAEHHEIDPLLEGCEADLLALARRPDADARAAFQVRIVAMAERLQLHLAHEERDALALVQRYLSVDDWHRVDADYFRKTATPRYLAFAVPWALSDLPASARARITGPAGSAYLILAILLRPAFRRLDRAAFRYVP